MRIAQMGRDVGAGAIREGAARGVLAAPSHLLVDGQVDGLCNRFREHIRALGIDGGQLLDQPTSDSKHEPADDGWALKGPGEELSELDVSDMPVVRKEHQEPL